MKRVVVSQPMFFPWVGLFEQVRLADVFVHYDDAQLPQGRSFTTRVQVKTAQGPHWLTVPVLRAGRVSIEQARVDDAQPWRERHLATLRHAYARAPFRDEMLAHAESVYGQGGDSLCALDIASVERTAAWFGLGPEFRRSSSLACAGRASEKLVAIVRALQGDVYVTGHGAREYLEHELFERSGIAVEYMAYERAPYPQAHGAFDPHVSVLDLMANVGREGAKWIRSATVPWREFVRGRG